MEGVVGNLSPSSRTDPSLPLRRKHMTPFSIKISVIDIFGDRASYGLHHQDSAA